jgi:uncharacterized OB-fold protein
MTVADADKIPPRPDAFSSEFWEAAREGKLLVQRCRTTGERQFYPRAHCTVCYACEPEWVQAAGTGTLYSYSVAYRAFNPGWSDETPYVFAVVALGEGPHITTNVVDVPFDELACEMPVRVVFRQQGEFTVPKFTRA